MMTVAQMSKRTGVSVRTLHHYDQIGLLKSTEEKVFPYLIYPALLLVIGVLSWFV